MRRSLGPAFAPTGPSMTEGGRHGEARFPTGLALTARPRSTASSLSYVGLSSSVPCLRDDEALLRAKPVGREPRRRPDPSCCLTGRETRVRTKISWARFRTALPHKPDAAPAFRWSIRTQSGSPSWRSDGQATRGQEPPAAHVRAGGVAVGGSALLPMCQRGDRRRCMSPPCHLRKVPRLGHG